MESGRGQEDRPDDEGDCRDLGEQLQRPCRPRAAVLALGLVAVSREETADDRAQSSRGPWTTATYPSRSNTLSASSGANTLVTLIARKPTPERPVHEPNRVHHSRRQSWDWLPMNPMTAMIGMVIAKSTSGGPNTYATPFESGPRSSCRRGIARRRSRDTRRRWIPAAGKKPRATRHCGLASIEIADRSHRLANMKISGHCHRCHAFAQDRPRMSGGAVGLSAHSMAPVRKAPIHAGATAKARTCHCLIVAFCSGGSGRPTWSAGSTIGARMRFPGKRANVSN